MYGENLTFFQGEGLHPLDPAQPALGYVTEGMLPSQVGHK